MDLFQDHIFWLSAHVPVTIKRELLQHGGKVVLVEADATIHLADPQRSNRPGAYSWHWVRDCIERRRLLDVTPYRIGRMVLPSHSQESAEPSVVTTGMTTQLLGHKRVRVEFTAEDDRVLRHFVRQRGRPSGEQSPYSVSGYKLYKELEVLAPRHSFHSWRDRWLKKLALLPQTEDDISVAGEPDEADESLEVVPIPPRPRRRERVLGPPQRQVVPPPAIVAAAPRPRPSPARETEVQRPPPPQAHGGAVAVRPQRPPPRARSPERHAAFPTLPFLEQNDVRLISNLQGSPPDLDEAGLQALFQEMSSRYEGSTAEDWSRRYTNLHNQLAALQQRASEEAAAAAGAQRQGLVEGDDAAGDDAAGEDGSDAGVSDTSILNEAAAQDEHAKAFYLNLELYGTENGIYVPPSIMIGGRYLETWALWLAVREVSAGPENRDWKKIVEALKLDVDAYPRVEQQLATWYNQNLLPYEQLYDSYMESDEEGEDEVVVKEEAEEGRPAEEGEEAEGRPDEEGEEAEGRPEEEGEEAEGRPEEEGEEAEEGEPAEEGEEEDGDNDASQLRNGLTELGKRRYDEVFGSDSASNDDDDEESAFEPQPEQKTLPRAPQTPRRLRQTLPRPAAKMRKAVMEPETQDFAMGPETQVPMDIVDDDGDGDDAAATPESHHSTNVTPSQQLRSEQRVVTTAAAAAATSARSATPSRTRRRTESPSMARLRSGRRSLPATFRNSSLRAGGQPSMSPVAEGDGRHRGSVPAMDSRSR